MNKPIVMQYKTWSIAEAAHKVPWHPLLMDLYRWINKALLIEMPTISDTYRKNDPKTHGTNPLRAFDLQTRGLNYDWPLIERTINEYWQYDYMRPDKPCAWYHDAGTGLHLHCQVHPNTSIINGGWSVSLGVRKSGNKNEGTTNK